MPELLEIARAVAVQAGDEAARRRREGVEVAATKSSPVDVVTQVDRDTETFVRAELERLRPGDGFLGEEFGTVAGDSGLTWIVDPIDGTVNFLYDLPHWAVSVAVVEGDPDPLTWRALAGVVYNPVSGELFTAAVGEGAELNGLGIRASGATELASSLVATGFSYDATRRAEQGAVVARMLPQVRDIRRWGTASLDLCFTACGRLDAYVERGLQPWDHAAAALIAAESGARVGGFGDAPVSREMTLVSAPGIASELETLLLHSGF